ncbi:hypothetical protein [Kineococcus radiotolerans]|uniref:Uncharacterized protein n=1 Tax=Kineococcus radiotolerans (strain ATCC BAA-149 / DSM 14245 / SRS30216) TaxID=266940 RepID=A6WH48_KINRD|nr:hypothetical protein [Kineococcus radiotolerans]ABS06137.1 hypothetical protein Krad_4679 [Kineococcus radiotolerans SRS30216 = ATCC BAA-149]
MKRHALLAVAGLALTAFGVFWHLTITSPAQVLFVIPIVFGIPFLLVGTTDLVQEERRRRDARR